MDGAWRIALYRLLGYGFTYPGADFVAQMRERVTPLQDGRSGGLPLSPLLHAVEALEGLPLSRLQAEHTRLFINNFPRLPAPPHESVYREGRLMGEASAELLALYGAWGLEVEPLLADHIGAELEFMAFLAALPAEEETLAARRHFLHHHLLAWAPTFAKDVEQAAELPFYRSLAVLLRTFLLEEAQALPSTR